MFSHFSHSGEEFAKDYFIEFAQSSDTANFEGVYNKKFDLTKYYYYHEFSKPVRSFEIIEGIKYDSVKIIQRDVVDYQFSPPDMITVNPNETLKTEDTLSTRLNKHYGCFRIYKTKYLLDPHKDYSQYHSYNEFLRYEKNNSCLICTKIYNGE